MDIFITADGVSLLPGTQGKPDDRGFSGTGGNHRDAPGRVAALTAQAVLDLSKKSPICITPEEVPSEA